MCRKGRGARSINIFHAFPLFLFHCEQFFMELVKNDIVGYALAFCEFAARDRDV